MKAAIAQIACTPGDVPSNSLLIPEYAARARMAGCDFVLFPEMVDTGYEVETIRQHASPRSGLPFTTASKAAAHERIHIACGLSEREGDKIYNTLAVFNPEGELVGKYRKTHLFNPAPVNEGSCITAGDSLVLLNIAGFKCGLMICYDLRFPEMARALTLKGAEILLVSSAWPFPRSEHWQVLLKARAIENQVYVMGANRVGTDGGCTFCGSSTIVDAYGMNCATAAPDRSQLLVTEVDREAIEWSRSRLPMFKDRRPGLYQAG